MAKEQLILFHSGVRSLFFQSRPVSIFTCELVPFRAFCVDCALETYEKSIVDADSRSSQVRSIVS